MNFFSKNLKRLASGNFVKRVYVFRWVFLLLVLVIGVISLPSPSTMISMKSQSEVVDLVVVSARSSIISLPMAWDERKQQCLTSIILKPSVSTKISYTRPLGGFLYLSIEGGWFISSDNKAEIQEKGFASYVIGDPSKNCGVLERIRLPATGYLSVGSENVASPDNETLLSLENTISIYGRAVGSIFKVIPLNWGPFRANSLYFVESLQVPAGARISNAKGFKGNEVMWWGFIDVLISDTHYEGMRVYASSNAVSVDLFAPSPAINLDAANSNFSRDKKKSSAISQQADTIHFSSGARLLGDPNLRWFYALVTLVVLVIQLFSLNKKEAD